MKCASQVKVVLQATFKTSHDTETSSYSPKNLSSWNIYQYLCVLNILQVDEQSQPHTGLYMKRITQENEDP